MSNLQPLALLEDKRPQKGPLSTESDSGLDTGSNSFHWWRWRESKPTPILYHPAIFLYISVICDDSPIFSNWHQYVKVQESSGKSIQNGESLVKVQRKCRQNNCLKFASKADVNPQRTFDETEVTTSPSFALVYQNTHYCAL